jgi:hypothetical protein
MGRDMKNLVSNGASCNEAAVYNGANEQEVAEFILSTLREISIMAYSVAFTSLERDRIAKSIELLEGCINEAAEV